MQTSGWPQGGTAQSAMCSEGVAFCGSPQPSPVESGLPPYLLFETQVVEEPIFSSLPSFLPFLLPTIFLTYLPPSLFSYLLLYQLKQTKAKKQCRFPLQFRTGFIVWRPPPSVSPTLCLAHIPNKKLFSNISKSKISHKSSYLWHCLKNQI